MQPRVEPRWDGLDQLLDQRGLRAADDHYHSIDHAEALRLCALQAGESDDSRINLLAERCLAFLTDGRKGDATVRHGCDGEGAWTEAGDGDDVLQAMLMRALATAGASDLPIELRIAAWEWHDVLRHELVIDASARALACRLLAWAALDENEALSCRDLAEGLADELLCHWHLHAEGHWQWFEPRWHPRAAVMATAMWTAAERLDGEQYRTVAEESTRFVIDHLFEDGLFLPPGTESVWSPTSEKAVFDQHATETADAVELLCKAEGVGWAPKYGEYGDFALRWFTDNNLRGQCLIDPSTGACCDALCRDPLYAPVTPRATVAAMIAHHAASRRTLFVVEPTVVVR